ncbi:acyltransferase [Aestuariibacter sp. A3R04]|uniref:acyltransferase n=1 Tax=Aestuariibacter sp. A3R04 TaxID=2841571 RepID=UPI001C0931FB|nr:acyltransferase [Aestuariibacter sp. A3R04]MBU3021985.1 acyltransferase [Aestuariibacter sp. A3R04]
MRTYLAPLIFVVHTSLQIANLALWATLVVSVGLVKFLLPAPRLQRQLLNIMHVFMHCFGRISVMMIKGFNKVNIDYNTEGTLSKESWYLLIANHLSYLDIVLLIDFTRGRIPPPKFFLKQELIWLPFVGLGAWALDMPFMKRYSRAYIAKHPEKKGQDIETTKRFCQKFKTQPTTVINFVEGTRFTPAKHQAKGSQFTHLLPPKAGGIAFTLATMGELFTNILDVSLLYPNNPRYPMIAMLSGQMTHIVVDVNVLNVTSDVQGDYFEDNAFRTRFQQWLNDLWLTKDSRISQLLGR